MKTLRVLRISLLFLCAIGLISCRPLPKYTFHYVGLNEFDGDTLFLWRATADGLKSDKDYGKNPVALEIVRDGKVTFTGLMDTLHLYYIEGRNCGAFFYPEAGEVTYIHLGRTAYTNPHSLAQQYEVLREKGFPQEESRAFVNSNLQNAMGIYLLDHLGCRPNELDKIYEKSNPAMQDTVSFLLSLREQLSKTTKINEGDRYINFKQKGFEQDSICFSDYFNQDKNVCLFFANGDSDSAIAIIDELRNNYKNSSFIGYSTYITNRKFAETLRDTYRVSLFDDGKRYENSVMYKYRVDFRTKMNYFLLFDSKGRLIKTYIN